MEIVQSSVRQAYSVPENQISDRIIGAAIEAHRYLGGPGLLESIYEEALAWELAEAGLHVDRQVNLPILYKTGHLKAPLRIDLLVEHKVIVECKSTEKHNPVFEAQALTYLRLTGLRLALIINFGSQYVKNGIKRVVYNLPNESRSKSQP